ncbi:IS200/IS605 family transposase [Herbivorax sp. ANBcel31]|uniref:IS200/IS605 family transposase n=1 Tax=Herbivorax sp. ANBcel31 TaxID=3069754 RepID=UPI0027B34810|nr:IS200/IS605 family transposase [Herbivorax sp. ANBcel31]MDQ2085650.1 IS200/IS605 family transposase [Herbivorax sp. ANBcel31]
MPKKRRKVIYGKLRNEIGKYIRRLCEYKGVEILDAHACSDHIHMCVSIPPKHSVSEIVGYVKGKSAMMVFERHSKIRQNFKGQSFWARGYFVSTVGRNEAKVREYIRNQEMNEDVEDKLELPDPNNLF